tara:strand:- start:1542 stop:2816 length:1275 start_codon:yes stop_codon:yes gene_type:complete
MTNNHETLIHQEQAVIGSLLKNNDSFDYLEDLKPEAFFREDHQIIYKTIISFLNDGKPVDLIILAERMELEGNLDRCGGLQYVGSILSNTNTSKNIKSYAQSVLSAFKLRQIKSLLAQLTDSVESREGVEAIAEKAEAGLFDLLENSSGGDISHIREAVAEAIDWEDSNQKGLQPGLRDLNRMTNGFNKSNLIIIAGRPSHGKSSLAMQIAEHVSKQETVIIFSLEMSKREVGSRMVKYHERMIGKVQAVAHLYGLNLHIDDKPGITISHIRTQCRKIKRKHGLSMIVVDYLQLMRGNGDSRTQEVGSISRGLKGIAKEFDMPVIALSQLNRKVDDRSDKRPLMSDLRDSGEIEQDADMILFVYREEVYDKDTEFKNIAEIICRKNRSGSTGEITTTWIGDVTRFDDYNGQPISRSAPKKSGYD